MDDALKHSLSNIPMEELGLSMRPHNALRRAGLDSVLDVYRVIDDQSIWKIRNIGVKSIEEVIRLTEQFFTNLGHSLDYADRSPSSEQDQPVASIAAVEPTFPDTKFIADVPIDLLGNYLGTRNVEKLQSMDIRSIGDLDRLLRGYLAFLLPNASLPDRTIDALTRKVKARIDQKTLSPNALIESTALGDFLDWVPADDSEKSKKIRLLSRVYEEKSLTHEINRLTDRLTARQREFLLDYSLQGLTLEEIAKKQPVPVTRERIRQVLRDATTKLQEGLDASLKVYISTALEVAKEMDTSLSRDGWKAELIERKILLDSEEDYQSFDFFCALLKHKDTSRAIFGIPENVTTILTAPRAIPVYVTNFLNKGKKKEQRELMRNVRFTGGVAKEHARQILGCALEETSGILNSMNLTEVIPGWFTLAGELGLAKSTPLFRAGLIMMQTCGPLPFESFCDGLRRYILRRYEALTPREVLSVFLKNFGFTIENNVVSYEGEETVNLEGSDKLLLELLKEKGPVLSFQELVEFYLDRNYSFGTPATRVMPRSPIIEKIEQGLYKLRGSKVTWQEIESAKSRQEAFSRNAEVTYGVDGIIRFSLNVGTLSQGGVISISNSLQPLPDFHEGWPVFVNGENVGTARRDDLLVWGLSPAFNKLGVKLGDRIELAFDTWEEPRIMIRVVEKNDD